MEVNRIFAYLTNEEAAGLEMMRIELGLSQGNKRAKQTKKDRELLAMMLIALQGVMSRIREKKRLATPDGGQSAFGAVFVAWQDVCDELGVSQELARKMMELEIHLPERKKSGSPSMDAGAGSPEDEQ